MSDSQAGPSTQATEDFGVFLNHRGPDTKNTFVAHLYDALRFEGYRPFLDREALVEGNHNEESIYQALDMAKVHVAIVSKGYAESEYCLDELVAIMNSGKPVIPVFYDVEPKDLLVVEKGKFAVAFKRHKKHKNLQEWTDALGWLSKIVGCCFDPTCDEAKLKLEVVDAVKRVFPRCSGFVGENHRVGLEESKKEVIRKLEFGRVGVVGLYGMGGIGKTTLAAAVYEYCAQDFQHRSFLRDVRSSDTLTLQNQIIKDLRLKMSHEDYPTQFDKLKNLKVLIVVDDIEDERQFQDIILDLDKFGKGSRIIVTSRNQRVLSNVLLVMETERSVLHEVEVLNKMESQRLFNSRAFPSKSPDSGFEDLAVKVADACGGHPLALEIAGGFLRNKKLETDRVFWHEIAQKATGDVKLQRILKISYDNGLDPCQKTMFLDISCHLIGEPKVVALDIWASCESCGCGIRPGVHSSFIDLIEKCLVKVDTDGLLRMHDVLRDMGRGIVDAAVVDGCFTKWQRTHFWDSRLADDVLRRRKGSNKVRGFSRAWLDRAGDTDIRTYDAEAVSEMSELHLLVLDGCHVSGDFSNWSRELRLLQWRFFPLSELPLQLNLAKTVVLDLSGSTMLKRLWRDETPFSKARVELRRLILNDCPRLTTLSQDIGKRLSRLKVLELCYCLSLESLPDSIGEMQDLEQLILKGCRSLRSIPPTIGRLKKLEHLDLSCDKLKILPNTMGSLTALTTLKLIRLLVIMELPECFKGLISLVILIINSCPRLRTVMALPHSLRHLESGYCPKLAHLPSFKGLTSLATLTLCHCVGLKEIQGLHCLTSLEEVNLMGCTSMQRSTLQLQHSRAMRSCRLSGSGVSVKYDSDWSEAEPALQLITVCNDAFRFFDNCGEEEFFLGANSENVFMEATIVGENECVAVVICCVARDEELIFSSKCRIGYSSFVDVWIVRSGNEVFRSRELIRLEPADGRNQVHLCTLRRTHPLVRVLKHGDKIQVARQSVYPIFYGLASIVKGGAICVVHGHGEDQVISVNSRLLDVQQSREKKAEFTRLILADILGKRLAHTVQGFFIGRMPPLLASLERPVFGGTKLERSDL